MALLPDVAPMESLSEIVRQGYDTDTVAAICGAVLGARLGMRWIPSERFADRERLEAYTDAIVEASALPEDRNEFLRREAELTRLEVDFQSDLARD
jgi:ADP-ribosylglycohydrolase